MVTSGLGYASIVHENTAWEPSIKLKSFKGSTISNLALDILSYG